MIVFLLGDTIEIPARVSRIVRERGRMAVETSLDHLMQARGAIPVALVVGVENLVPLIDRNARRRTKPGGIRHKFALRSDLEAPATITRRVSHLAIVHPADVPPVALRPAD